MFNIKQSPVRPAGTAETRFVVAIRGSVIVINDEPFDFAFMEKGSTLPREAVDSPHFCSEVTCDDSGTISLTLLVPIGPAPTDAEAFPPTLNVNTDGTVIDIHLPADDLLAALVAPNAAEEVAANG